MEFSLVLPFLLVFSVVTIELLRVAYQQLSLQYVLAREKREVLLGAYPDSETIRAKFDEHLRRFGLQLGPEDKLTVCPMRDYQRTCLEGMVVTPPADTLMVMGVGREVELFILPKSDRLGRGNIKLGARSLGKSEPV